MLFHTSRHDAPEEGSPSKKPAFLANLGKKMSMKENEKPPMTPVSYGTPDHDADSMKTSPRLRRIWSRIHGSDKPKLGRALTDPNIPISASPKDAKLPHKQSEAPISSRNLNNVNPGDLLLLQSIPREQASLEDRVDTWRQNVVMPDGNWPDYEPGEPPNASGDVPKEQCENAHTG